MQDFLELWNSAATTTAGLFWMAFWAFGLGYLISSMIQVFVTRERMRKYMGDPGPASVGLGSLFGFISSSCSFAALSTTRSLFAKGAGLVPSLAFLLASTNLVIELGIVIAVFLGWQFVVGEYVGGALLILLMWLLVRISYPRQLIKHAREKARDSEEHDDNDESPDWKKLIMSLDGWCQVGNRYVMEWMMVWKDVAIGFTVAGIIAAFVPRAFFEALFIGSDQADPGFVSVLLQSIVGPIAAFFTFIGSMGNIPLAAVLYENGVSFAGIMAFIFSDLVVLPVLRIKAQYYGWRMALYILAIFFVILVTTALILHYGFAFSGALPDNANPSVMTDREFFVVDYTAFLNLVFLILSGLFLILHLKLHSEHGHGHGNGGSEKVLIILTCIALIWLVLGLLLPMLGMV
ncbi:MAG: permease [Gammaproteobacteria bacterium]